MLERSLSFVAEAFPPEMRLGPSGVPLQAAIRGTGMASLHEDDLKFSLAATVEHFKLPFICGIWLYIVASYQPPRLSS